MGQTLSQLETLSFKLKSEVNTVLAVYTAMEKGDCTAETFLDALYGVFDALSQTQDQIEKATLKLFEERKNRMEEKTA